MSREASCGGLESGSLYECLESGLHRRRAQLESEWGLRAADRDLTKVKQFSVGIERIDVNPSCGKDGTNCCISYKGKEIGCGWEGLYGEPPFSVLRRLKNGEDEAVLLGVRGGGQMNCVEYSILSVAAHRELQIQKFGEVCMVPSKYGHAFRAGQGFAFFREAAAAYPGEHLQWRFESGFSRTAVPFTPSGGKTIEELVDADPKNFVAPLHNETFYRAVAALPEPERARFLVSLSGLGGGCDCAGPADNSLYGLRNTPDVYAMSGCGLYLEGHFLHCSGADALAVWDKRSRKFHFAIAPDGERENRQPSAALHAFPPLENWTAPARSQLLDWRNKPKWEKGE
jgi:hypothetical protein